MANKKKYTILHPIIMSFYSKALYKDVGQNWRGVGFTYLFILLALCWIPLVYFLINSFLNFKDTQLAGMVDQVPEVRIDDGEISINRPMPFIIKDTETDKPVIIVDTSGEITSLEESGGKALITKNEIMVRKDKNKIETYQLPKDLDYTFNQSVLNKWIEMIAYWMIFSLYPILLIFSFLYRILQTLIYAAIGTIIFNGFIKAPIDYQAILRLSVIAITPAIIISTILSVLSIYIPYEWTLYFLLSMVYLIFGIRANKVIEEKVAEEQVPVEK